MVSMNMFLKKVCSSEKIPWLLKVALLITGEEYSMSIHFLIDFPILLHFNSSLPLSLFFTYSFINLHSLYLSLPLPLYLFLSFSDSLFYLILQLPSSLSPSLSPSLSFSLSLSLPLSLYPSISLTPSISLCLLSFYLHYLSAKSVYYIPKSVRDFMHSDQDERLKVVTAGVKVLERMAPLKGNGSKTEKSTEEYRLVQVRYIPVSVLTSII